MSGYDQRMLTGFAVIVFSLVCSLIRFRDLNKDARILSILVICTFGFEVFAECSARVFKTNMIVYSVFNVVQFFLMSVYFNFSIDVFKERSIGIKIGIVGVLYGIVNYTLIESPYRLESIYLMIEDVAIVALSLYSFYRLLLIDDDIVLTRLPNFWFTAIVLFYWTSTFLIWGTFNYLINVSVLAQNILLTVLLVVNIITYLGMGLVFLLYKRMQLVNGG